MRWEEILKESRFQGGVLETIVRNGRIPIVYRGRICAMAIDCIGLSVRLAPVVRQKENGYWERIEESVELRFDHGALRPEGRDDFPETAVVKWTLVDCGGGCVVVMAPIAPPLEGMARREVCQFAIFYPSRPNSAFEMETFGT
jgi:hypothetical protein